MINTVTDIINNIKESKRERIASGKRSYNSSSDKSELDIMCALLNDKNYNVNVYSKNSYQYSYNPSNAFRSMLTNLIANITGLDKDKVYELVKNYEFNNSDAKDLINLSKEFFNTYLFKTGNKLSLGGRDRSNVSLKAKTYPAGFVPYPAVVMKSDSSIYERKEAYVNDYDGLIVYNPCPGWRNSLK